MLGNKVEPVQLQEALEYLNDGLSGNFFTGIWYSSAYQKQGRLSLIFEEEKANSSALDFELSVYDSYYVYKKNYVFAFGEKINYITSDKFIVENR